MQPSTTSARRILYVVLALLLVLALLVKWCNTPRQDSSEKPLPNKEQERLLKQDEALKKQVEYYRHRADSAEVASDRAYAKGVQDAKEATLLHQQSRHASPVTRSASAAELQRILSNY